MREEHRIIIPGDPKKIRDVCDFVIAAAERAGLNENAIHHCQMAVDEACTNIIEHGYQAAASQEQVEVVCRDSDDRFSISILDNSPPFNPLAKEDPDPATPLAERAQGGWGIYFIKKMADDIAYTHEGGRNRLTLTKFKSRENLSSPSGPAAADSLIPVNVLDTYSREIVPNGRLDSTTSPILKVILNTQLKDGITRFVVNMSQVSYISTGGLKVLVNAWRSAREHGGDLLLAGMSRHVFEVFEVVGFDQVFSIYDSLDEAVHALGDERV